MNFMRIKKIGKMATAAIIAFIAVVVFINPQKAQASQGGANGNSYFQLCT